jgi:hypothetical protein
MWGNVLGAGGGGIRYMSETSRRPIAESFHPLSIPSHHHQHLRFKAFEPPPCFLQSPRVFALVVRHQHGVKTFLRAQHCQHS